MVATTCAPPVKAGHTFAGETGSLVRMRGWVRTAVGAYMSRAAMDDLLLVATELATNAVKHSHSGLRGGTYAVAVQVTAETARVAVLDQGGEEEPCPAPAASLRDLDAEGGRGLAILREICADTGWDGDCRARCVWALLTLRADGVDR